MAEIIKAVILARVSTKEQAVEGYSLDAQQKLLEKYASDKELGNTKAFYIAETASKEKQRQVFNEMMDFVKARKIKVIVVEKVDRLVRNFKDTVLIDEWLEEDPERKIHFVKDSLILHKNARSQEKLNWGMRVVIAKNFIDNLREETTKVVNEKIAQGWYPGIPPRGYKTVSIDGKKVQIVDSKVAPLVKKMFQLYLEEGQSLATLTLKMRKLGLTTRTGRPFNKSNIANLLSNAFYIGKLPWMGQIYPGNQVPIIDKQLFDAVQYKLRRKMAPRYAKHNHLFRGMIRCEECGGMISWTIQKGKKYGYCNGYKGCSNKRGYREDEVEETLVAELDRMLSPSQAILEWVRGTLLEQHQVEMTTRYSSLKSLKAQHDTTQRKMDILYDDRLVGRISAELYDTKIKTLTDERQAILDAIDEQDSRQTEHIEAGVNVLELSQKAAELYRSVQSTDAKREVIGAVFDTLTAGKEGVNYEYSEWLAVVVERIEKTRELENTFKPAHSKSKAAAISAARPIWYPRQDSNLRP